jgi:cytoskeletal protein CcmA (bactofilin family)
MFGWRRCGTIIGQGLKVEGKVTADGLVKVYGQIDGELQCASLVLARKAQFRGAVTADKVVIDGKVEGPIRAANVVLKPRAHVVGDIHHQSLDIRKGACFEGRSVQVQGPNGSQPVGKKQTRRPASANLDLAPATDPAV